ncbi:MAG: S41 family peptidase [Pseudomonadota bacterium]
MSEAYLTQPAVFKNLLVFVTDDDLWSVQLSEIHQPARRLTSVKGRVRTPVISPDGSTIAYSSNQSGEFDVYLMPSEGGVGKRLTWMGYAYVAAWLDLEQLVIVSEHETQVSECYIYNLKTGAIKRLGLGPSQYFARSKNSIEVLGRNIGDPAKWKGYRGGTAGTLWVKEKGGTFSQILKSLPTNIGAPKMDGNHIYFVSDHEGVGNIYTTNLKGGDLRQITFEKVYYVRDFSVHQGKIVYQAGGRLFLNQGEEKSESLKIKIFSQWEQSQERFEQPERFLQYGDLNEEGKLLLAVVRGQLVVMEPWAGGLHYLKHPEVVRIKFAAFFAKGILAVGVDKFGLDVVLNFTGKQFKPVKKLLRVLNAKIMEFHSGSKWAALVTSQHEVLVTDGSSIKKIAKSPYNPVGGLSWSPDGLWLAMSLSENQVQAAIYLWNSKSGKLRRLMTPVIEDHSPCFDDSGDYLYFLSVRDVVAEMAEFHGEIMIPHAVRPYVVRLNEKAPSLFVRPLQIEDSDEGAKEDWYEDYTARASARKKPLKKSRSAASKKGAPSKKAITVKVDFEGLDNRMESFPTTLGGWRKVIAMKDKAFFMREDMRGAEPGAPERMGQYLFSYSLRDGEWEEWHQGVLTAIPSKDGKSLLLGTLDGVRLVSTEAKPRDGDLDTRKDGWIDLQRIRLKVTPRQEWKHMYLESWILQKEHFHAPKDVDWDSVYNRYVNLVDLVHTRWELSDVIRDMQGDLRTSHCYEYGGDYARRGSDNLVGRLGAYLTWIPEKKCFKVEDIPRGDSWLASASSPLLRAGLHKGDMIVAIDGERFAEARDLERSLEHKAFKRATITWLAKGKERSEAFIPLSDLLPLNYRVWVDTNRRLVSESSKGRLGYIHIPDMGLEGFAEFMRGFLPESQKDGLIIDTRYNGGGFASEFVLRYLTQKVIGRDLSQKGAISKTYPFLASRGPMVCVTNEFAGSDGDIFCHAFKRLSLGPLVGTRTWGGTIGIWPRMPLIDGTITSQPEFVFHFDDVGHSLENKGTTPDIEVMMAPEDWAKRHDSQLMRAIEEAQKLLKKMS